MKIIEPKVEFLEQTDIVSHVCRCARICYRKETGNDNILYTSLLNKKHNSMFRHATYYFIIPLKYTPKWLNNYFNAICFKAKIIGIDIKFFRETYYVVTNGNWNLDHQDLLIDINDYIVSAKEFANANEIAWNMMRYTFKVTTQISTSRELNRVSPNNISEQSTRYVYEDGTICHPHWMTNGEVEYFNNTKYDYINSNYIVNHQFAWEYINSCIDSFSKYKRLVNNGMHRQDARGTLPLDTATICAYTYSVKEWRDIIDLRYYGTTGQPHPNAKIAAGMIRNELMNLGYEFR